MIATTRPDMSVSEPTLFVAFELSKKTWKLALTSGFGVVIRSYVAGVTSFPDLSASAKRSRSGAVE